VDVAFLDVFGMEEGDFESLPEWKQAQLKSKVIQISSLLIPITSHLTITSHLIHLGCDVGYLFVAWLLPPPHLLRLLLSSQEGQQEVIHPPASQHVCPAVLSPPTKCGGD